MSKPFQDKAITAYDLHRSASPSVNFKIVALLLTVVWVIFVGCLRFFFEATIDTAIDYFIALLPVGLIWIISYLFSVIRALKNESLALQQEIAVLRTADEKQKNGALQGSAQLFQDKLRKLERGLESVKSTVTVLSDAFQGLETNGFFHDKDGKLNALIGADSAQKSTHNSQPTPIEDFVRALNFPDDSDDAQGFFALSQASSDKDTKDLIRSAKDALKLLNHDGIYMEHFDIKVASSTLWRQFAQKKVARSAVRLGSVEDNLSLRYTAERIQGDAMFRDTVQHFIRRFDSMLRWFEKIASDDDIRALTDTKTGRAYILLICASQSLG